MKRLASVFSNILIVILLTMLAAILVSKLVLKQEMRAVLTPSMEPELPVGSLLIIEPTPYEQIKIGDDITFVRDKNLTLVTHRVIEKDDETRKITTKGIANNAPDAPTEYKNVVGKVVFSIPYIGYLVIWVSDLKGKIIFGIIIAALVALSLLMSTDDNDTDNDNGSEEKS